MASLVKGPPLHSLLRRPGDSRSFTDDGIIGLQRCRYHPESVSGVTPTGTSEQGSAVGQHAVICATEG